MSIRSEKRRRVRRREERCWLDAVAAMWGAPNWTTKPTRMLADEIAWEQPALWYGDDDRLQPLAVDRGRLDFRFMVHPAFDPAELFDNDRSLFDAQIREYRAHVFCLQFGRYSVSCRVFLPAGMRPGARERRDVTSLIPPPPRHLGAARR